MTSLIDLRFFTDGSEIPSGYGGGIGQYFAEEEATLGTGSKTTDSAANLLPSNSRIMAVSYRVTGADAIRLQVFALTRHEEEAKHGTLT